MNSSDKTSGMVISLIEYLFLGVVIVVGGVNIVSLSRDINYNRGQEQIAKQEYDNRSHRDKLSDKV
ncbi:MAG: hypothetical protein PHE29_14225 [Tissierellia bacterium]|nr:hypothetical protein [Tissierellia bacterium]